MTEPYYADDLVTLYLGNCLEMTEWLQADVLVTDPPYGMAYESNFNRIKGTQKVGRPVAGDETPALRDDALAMWAMRGPGVPERPALVFGRWNVPRPTGTRTRLIWDRMYHGMGDLGLPWGPTEEEIYVLGTGFVGERSSNIIRAHGLMAGSSDRPDHPTPKPVGLMEVLVAKTTGVVADPFAGSGATLLAARNLGRTAIGVEIEGTLLRTHGDPFQSTSIRLRSSRMIVVALILALAPLALYTFLMLFSDLGENEPTVPTTPDSSNSSSKDVNA